MTPLQLDLLDRKLRIESLLSRPLILTTSEREGLEQNLSEVCLTILRGLQGRRG